MFGQPGCWARIGELQMIEITIDEKSLEKLRAYLDKLGVRINDLSAEAVDRGTERIANHARNDHFFVGTGKGAAQAAKEGEFKFLNPDGSLRFKVRTGNLIASIQSRGAKVLSGKVIGQVFVGEKYARDVEEGTAKTRAFPFLRPAMEIAAPKIAEDLLKLINNAVG